MTSVKATDLHSATEPKPEAHLGGQSQAQQLLHIDEQLAGLEAVVLRQLLHRIQNIAHAGQPLDAGVRINEGENPRLFFDK